MLYMSIRKLYFNVLYFYFGYYLIFLYYALSSLYIYMHYLNVRPSPLQPRSKRRNPSPLSQLLRWVDTKLNKYLPCCTMPRGIFLFSVLFIILLTSDTSFYNSFVSPFYPFLLWHSSSYLSRWPSVTKLSTWTSSRARMLRRVSPYSARKICRLQMLLIASINCSLLLKRK